MLRLELEYITIGLLNVHVQYSYISNVKLNYSET